MHGVRRGAALLEGIPPDLKLPIAEICLPALRRYPVRRIQGFSALVRQLAKADDTIDAFEFALMKLVDGFCADLLDSGRKPARQPRPGHVERAVALLFRTLAKHSRFDADQRTRVAQLGYQQFFGEDKQMPRASTGTSGWTREMDAALQTLDAIGFRDKRRLLQAAIVTIEADGVVVASERELLRAIAAALHVPLAPARGAGS
jgi:hypothetical protein